MNSEQMIQISLQLPADQLGQFSLLMERLREVMQVSGSGSAAPEAARSEHFDMERFQTLQAENKSADVLSHGKDAAAVSVQTDTFPAEAASVRGDKLTEIPSPERVSADANSALPVPGSAAKEVSPLETVPAATVPDMTELTDRQYRPLSGEDRVQQPLTANAVLAAEDISAAFRRDDRRYDNGFPLY